MKQWEYKVFECKGLKVEDSLDQFGKEGWELTTVTNDTFYMKREKKSKVNEPAKTDG